MTNDTFLNLGLIPIFGIMIQLFKIGIDNINMEGIEKKFITNSKYYGIFGSNLLIITLLFGGSAILLTYIIGIYEYTNIEKFLENSRRPLFTIFSFVLFWFAALYWTTSLIGVKSQYYLYITDKTNNRWFVVRRLDKNKTLLSDSENKFKLYENSNLYNLTIYKAIIAPTKKVMKFTFIYTSLKKLVIMIYVLLILLIIAIWLPIFSINFPNPLFLTYIFILVLLLLYNISSVVKGNMKLIIGSSCDLNDSSEESE